MYKYYIVIIETDYGIEPFKFHTQIPTISDKFESEIIDKVKYYYDGNTSFVNVISYEEECFVRRL